MAPRNAANHEKLGATIAGDPGNMGRRIYLDGNQGPQHVSERTDSHRILVSRRMEGISARSYWLATYAESMLCDLFGTETIGRRELGWYGSMAHVPLPPGDWSRLQRQLWDQVGIEVPIIHFHERWYVRVSCHLYNNTTQINTLVQALHRLCV